MAVSLVRPVVKNQVILDSLSNTTYRRDVHQDVPVRFRNEYARFFPKATFGRVTFGGVRYLVRRSRGRNRWTVLDAIANVI